MHILDVYNEFESHYSGCFAVDKDGAAIKIKRIIPPEPTSVDDYGDASYGDYPTNLELASSIDLFTIEALYIESSSDLHQDVVELHLCDIVFVFPESKLINCNTLLTDGSTFNYIKYISRYSTRQYRRALRLNYLIENRPNAWLIDHLCREGVDLYNIMDSHELSDNEIGSYINPLYYSYTDAINKLDEGIGTYALSPNWWVGQGTDGIDLGWNSHSVGTVDSTSGLVSLNNNVSFLETSLIETLGDMYCGTR